MSLDRRDFLKRLSGSIVALMGIPFSLKLVHAHNKQTNRNRMVYDWRTPKKNKSEYKNVVLLLFDDLRHDTFSFLGSPVQTPNIDSLKKEAVYFQNACTTTGLCSPSRAALFTGRLGHRTGLDDNCHVWHSQLMGLSLNEETILEWARQKDYFVGYFGKWHLGPNGLARRGVHRFLTHNKESERIGKLPEKPDFDSIKRYYDKNKTFDEKPEYYATLKGSYEDTPAYQKTAAAIDFLNEAKDVDMPFFLTVSYNSPHPPYRV
ncbi:MAG: sulfatase-like hydrolase/transferase, partial [Caldisericaceae bacterium]|nr:sulfatase-like hydrolase/transferase [Caldisericaceae bacterium]